MGASAAASPPSTARPARNRIRRRLRRGGWLLLTVLCATAVAAIHTANNRLYLVLGGMLALLLAELVLGAWNLRNLHATRRLPPELFAARRAGGRISVSNARRVLPAAALRIREQGRPARSHAAWLGAGEQLSVPFAWRFETRGQAQLRGLELASRFPFGLFEHRLLVESPLTVLVYPATRARPGDQSRRTLGSHQRDDDHHRPRASGAGDFLDLRDYQPGDPTRLIHWPTTARAGRPMIVVRGTDVDEEAVVRLDEQDEPTARERAISKACGELLHHARLGRAVGLVVGRRRWPPRRGAAQLRSLLEALALLPHAPEGEPTP
jgi:uncharacterized protein (DUF58 family)